jgi:hypothetical protein
MKTWSLMQCLETAAQDEKIAAAEYLDAPTQQHERELNIAATARQQLEKLAKTKRNHED